MRNYKFQAWDKYNKKMMKGVGVTPTADLSVAYIIDEFGEPNYGIDASYIRQYTEIQDSKGTEIYGGDIVKMTCFLIASNGLDIVGEVKMLEGGWHVDSGERLESLWSEIHQVEIIGNIYEHPHLLEQEDPS